MTLLFFTRVVFLVLVNQNIILLEVDSLRVQEICVYISQWITHVVKCYWKIQRMFPLNTVAYEFWSLPFAITEMLASRLKLASLREIRIYSNLLFSIKVQWNKPRFLFLTIRRFQSVWELDSIPSWWGSIPDHRKVWHLDSISSCVNWRFFILFLSIRQLQNVWQLGSISSWWGFYSWPSVG